MTSLLFGISRAAVAPAILILAACGGGGGAPSVSVGGTISGLAGSGLVLSDNGMDHLAVSGNGAFTFATKLSVGSAYSVGVVAQPANQLCKVSNGSGTVSAGGVTTVSVMCKTVLFTVGGTATGIASTVGTLTLSLSSTTANTITLQGDGPFSFAAVPTGTQYAVFYVGAVSNATCSILNASGTVGSSNITNIVVTCVPPPTYSGQISVYGLTGPGLVLGVGGQTLAVSQDGTYPFPTGVAASASVSVVTQPNSDFCVAGSFSVVPGTYIDDVRVTCHPYVYTLGGTVTGLKGSGLVLTNNGTNLAVNSNGPFLFGPPLLAIAETYSVSVATQPSNPTQYCIVQNSSGTITGANVTSPAVNCSTPRFAFGIAANQSGHPHAVVAYLVDPDSGALTPVAGSPYPAGDSTSAIAVDPGTRFLYATNQGAGGGAGSNTISAYTIDAASGALTAVPGSPFPSAAAPIAIAVEPGGKYLYVANVHDNTIAAFAIDSGSGALSSVTGGPVVAGIDGPRQLVVHPNGKFLYAAAANESLYPVLRHRHRHRRIDAADRESRVRECPRRSGGRSFGYSALCIGALSKLHARGFRHVRRHRCSERQSGHVFRIQRPDRQRRIPQ